MAWTVVLFGALSAIAIAVYGIANGGFRPDAQWLQLVDELRARGEPVVFEEIVPPELPEAENFFAAPLFGNPETEDSKLLAKAQQPLGGRPAGEWLTLAAQGGSANLAPLADAMKAANLSDAEYLLPADAVIAGMQRLGFDFSPLREAARRPSARLPIEDSQPTPTLPHLADIQALADWLAIDALARIATGNGTAAADAITLIDRLADALETEPFLDAQRARRQLLALAAGCVRAGLDTDAFDDEALSRLAGALADTQLLEGLALAVRGERAALNTAIETTDTAPPALATAWLEAQPADLAPRELRARRIHANRTAQMFLDQLSSPSGLAPAALLPPAGETVPPRLAQLAEEARMFAQVQTYVSQARIACALERFRLAHGAYPAALEELSPEFLAEIPADPMTGAAPVYENGGAGCTLTGNGWEAGSPWVWKS